MTNKADIFLESPIWEEKLPQYEALIEEAIDTVKEHFQDLPEESTMSLVLADDAFIQTLNLQYRGKDKPTNVLSFPMLDDVLMQSLANSDDGEVLLGDIVLAAETVLAEAQAKGWTAPAYVQHLIVHGTLHLLGYDHELGAHEAEIMESLERAACVRLGMPDHYGD